MKVNTYIFSLLLVFLSLVACEQTIDLELPEYDGEIVLYGILTAGDNPKIFLSESTSYFEPINNRDRLEIIDDAEVILNDGTQTYNLPFEPELFSYPTWSESEEDFIDAYFGGFTNDLIIEEEKTYSIEIIHNGRTITGQTTVPKSVNLKNATHEFELFDDPFSPGFTCFRNKIEIHFDDPEEENFYQINNTFERWSYDFCDRYIDTLTTEVDSCFLNKGNYYLQVFDDVSFNGSSYAYQINNFAEFCTTNGIDTVDLPESRGYSINKYTLQSVSKELYDFNISLRDQANSEFNPFQEPSTIRSTVEGGIGVFASKSAASDTIVLRVDERF